MSEKHRSIQHGGARTGAAEIKNPWRQRRQGLFRPILLPESVLHNHGLTATLSVLDLKRDFFALLNFLLSCTLQDRGMQEHVLPAIIRRHEAEATNLVEPLHRTIDGIGRPTLVTATELAALRTVTEGAGRAEATGRTTKAVAATKVTARRAVAETTAWRTEATGGRATKIATRRAVAKATARRTEATGGRATKIAARRTVA
ncbi:MAG: hypothetical protein JWP20_1872, partial [Roseomonas sp.]|nr:hypothetical protein [Roseomonas sp.]